MSQLARLVILLALRAKRRQRRPIIVARWRFEQTTKKCT
jgi:hypothetical protein